MRMKIHLMIACIALLSMLACGGAGGLTGSNSGGSKLSINFVKAKDTTLEEKSSVLYHIDEERYLVISNADLSSFGKSSQTDGSVKADGQMRIRIRLYDKSAGDDTPIQPGEYSFDSQNPRMLTRIHFYYFADGKEQTEEFSTSGATGSVKINSVSGDTATGEIDIKGREGHFIKGSFKAKIVKES